MTKKVTQKHAKIAQKARQNCVIITDFHVIAFTDKGVNFDKIADFGGEIAYTKQWCEDTNTPLINLASCFQ